MRPPYFVRDFMNWSRQREIRRELRAIKKRRKERQKKRWEQDEKDQAWFYRNRG